MFVCMYACVLCSRARILCSTFLRSWYFDVTQHNTTQHNNADLWLQKSYPTLFESKMQNPAQPLISHVSKRTIFHELAIEDPTKMRNAIAFNFVSHASETVSEVRETERIPWTFVPGIDWGDTYGWKTSDYLIAKGAMDSLLMMCVWVMWKHSDAVGIHDRGRGPKLSIDFSWISRCSALFSHVLIRVPPEVSTTLDSKDWPAGGKSSRQLALDLGHMDIVQLIDFIQFHQEGSSLVSYVGSRAAFIEGSFAAAKMATMTLSGLIEAGAANSKCHV